MSEDRIEMALRPRFDEVIKSVREAMKNEESGTWTALGGPVSSHVSINAISSYGNLKTTWSVEAQITPTNSNWDGGGYRVQKSMNSYPTEQDMYGIFMFFRNQGPWCAANAFYDGLKSLFKAGVDHDAVRDFVDGETVRSVMAD